MTDRLDRLERHLSEVLAGPRRLMRSLGKHTTGSNAMTQPSESAYPHVKSIPAYSHEIDKEYTDTYSEGGLTKREMFAAMAMQGLLSHRPENAFPYEIADAAVEFADALIEELNKETP